jgi:uncharacterized protein (UPF0548 family)
MDLRKPTPEVIRRFLECQQPLAFTYDAVGATAGTPPSGYDVDHTRVHLGDGEAAFRAACAALARWQHFDLGWVETFPANLPLETGATVAVLARVLGFWWLNACRIVYTIDEPGPARRFGFAYGTLPGHAESGEERFQIEWDEASGAVHYDILAFSRPRHLLARLGYPLARLQQRRFARDSAAAMMRGT